MTSANGVSTTAPPPINANVRPAANSPDLVLVPASPAEAFRTQLLNAEEWKGPLDLDTYIAREEYLLKQDLVNNSQLTCWILTSTALPTNPDGTRPILAACESLLKSAYVARNGVLRRVLAHGIASVFTRLDHRGHGYAGRMMTELGKKLESWQQPAEHKATFSVLFSDIGPNYYPRFGWNVFPSNHIHLNGLDVKEYEDARTRLGGSLGRDLPEVADLRAEDLPAIQASEFVEEFLAAESRRHSNVPHVAIRPDLQHFTWHHAREEFQCQALGNPTPLIKGAVHKESGIALIWCRVYESNPKDWSLHILHVIIPPRVRTNPGENDYLALAALLLRAQRESQEWKMEAGVEVWDPSDFVVAAVQGLKTEQGDRVTVIKRDKEHLCSLRWIGEEEGDDPNGKVVWLNIEKYAWC